MGRGLVVKLRGGSFSRSVVIEVVGVGSPDCSCKCFPGLVGCIIVNDDA
jgi:hypothetical protein